MKNFASRLCFFLLTISTTAYGSTVCSELFKVAKTVHDENRLIELGYDPSVAQRILSLRPDVAMKILEKNDDTAKAMTLYRGIGRPPDQIKANFQGSYEVTFFSRSLEDGILYAERFGEDKLSWVDLVAQKKTIGTILKIQLPAFLSTEDIPGSFFPAARLIDRKDIEDFSPFISEIGIVDVTYGKSKPEFLQWHKYDNVPFDKTPH